MKQIEIARMGALSVKLTQSLINGRSRIIYLVNFLNLTSGQPWTYVQVVRQQIELGIPKRTTVSVEPCVHNGPIDNNPALPVKIMAWCQIGD